jgi:DNA primase
MISKDFVQKLVTSVDIVDIVGKTVELKKSGGNFHGLCPFHTEKTSSFTVSQPKQFYHCFGCGAHGSVINFVRDHMRLGFIDTINFIAAHAGIEVVHEASESNPAAKNQDFPDMLDMLQKSADFYYEELKNSKTAIAYLKTRGITGKTAKEFCIGYAPEEWNALKPIFQNYDDPLLETCGMVAPKKEGQSRRDWFHGRIVFPIHNIKGRVIGFGGRVLDDTEPKYLNTCETPLFEKGKELYGLHKAQHAIRDSSTAIVVEGYMDVVALHQHGVINAVATLGTATTPDNLYRLLRMADNVVFCFDGDRAGLLAAWKALKVALPCITDGKRISFIFLPEGQDPDDYIRAEGRDKFDQLVEKAETLSSFMFRKLAEKEDFETAEGRITFVKKTHNYYLNLQINAPSLANLFKKEIASATKMSKEEISALYASDTSVKPKYKKILSGNHAINGKKILLCIASNPTLGKTIDKKYLKNHYLDDDIIEIINLISDMPQNSHGGTLTQQFKDTRYEDAINVIQAELLSLGEDFDEQAEIKNVIKNFRCLELTLILKDFQDKVESNGLDSLNDEDKVKFKDVMNEYLLHLN